MANVSWGGALGSTRHTQAPPTHLVTAAGSTGRGGAASTLRSQFSYFLCPLISSSSDAALQLQPVSRGTRLQIAKLWYQPPPKLITMNTWHSVLWCLNGVLQLLQLTFLVPPFHHIQPCLLFISKCHFFYIVTLYLFSSTEWVQIK